MSELAPLISDLALILICAGVMTVSYTHLDVYKRQLYICTKRSWPES